MTYGIFLQFVVAVTSVVTLVSSNVYGATDGNTTSPSGEQQFIGDHQELNNTQTQIVDKEIRTLIPVEWDNSCDTEFKYISGSNFTSQWAFLFSCYITGDFHWTLHDYREWISDNEMPLKRIIPIGKDLRLAFILKCSDEGTVSLPWPIKAKYLWHISVDNCKIQDFLQEFDKTEMYQDDLKVIEITNSILENNVQQFIQTLMNFNNMTRQYYCGAEALEKLVFSNVTKTVTGLMDMSPPQAETGLIDMPPQDNTGLMDMPPQANKTEIFDAFSKVNQQSQSSPFRCRYSNLRYLDESRSRAVAADHVQLLTENADLPALEYYNFSHSKLHDMTIQFLEWRRFFPRMKYLDLSHNRIKYISRISDKGLSTDPLGVIDLRYNNITSLSKDDINTLKFQSETVFIDIRNNPLVCDCKLSDLMNTIKNRSSVLLDKYDFILDMQCAKPASLAGKKLSQLDKEYCEFIEVFSLVVPVVILACCLVLLTAVLFVVIRYRKEIMILAFTRLNISLPCREVTNVNKEYDAFVCYSEHDMRWVIHTLLPRLEEPENGPAFKLCIHHRDFAIGGTIFDNIDSKVKESRHTVLILSNHFLRSTWCKCEFWAAFSESLTQKKRHLIMVITEDLEEELIEPTMKRCLKTFTYVKTDDRLFWDKLVYSLSDKKEGIKTNHNRNRNEVEPAVEERVEKVEINNGYVMNEMLDGFNNNRAIQNALNDNDAKAENANKAEMPRVKQIHVQNNIHLRHEVEDGNYVRNNLPVHYVHGVHQDGEWII